MATGQGPLKGTLANFFKKMFLRLRCSNAHPSLETQNENNRGQKVFSLEAKSYIICAFSAIRTQGSSLTIPSINSNRSTRQRTRQSMAAKPSDVEISQIFDCQTLAQWCGINPTTPTPVVAPTETPPLTKAPHVFQPAKAPAGPPLAAAPPLDSDMKAFFGYIGCGPQEHFRSFATMSAPDWAAIMTDQTDPFLVNGAKPNVMLRSKVLLFHATARRLCKLEPWPETTPPTSTVTGPTMAPSQNGSVQMQNNAVMPARVNLPTLNVGKVLDQSMSDEITYLESDEVLKMNARYFAIFETEPPQEKSPTLDQLTALHFSITHKRRPYADLGVFGRYGGRRARAMAFTGLVAGPGGTLHNVEIQGPPSLEAWKESYDVLFSALIMLDTVRRPHLAAYRAKICLFHAQFGAQCWALLYQADVRCRSELMERLRFREQAKHNAAMQATPPKQSSFDPSRPWDTVWAVALEETEFWEREFKHNALLIRTNTINIAQTLGTDARIASSSSAAGADWYNAPQRDVSKAAPKGKPVTAATNKGPCRAFNTGHCTGTKCPSGHGAHKCSICGLTNHGASTCSKGAGGKKRKWQGKK
jgi:hypothetical protein